MSYLALSTMASMQLDRFACCASVTKCGHVHFLLRDHTGTTALAEQDPLLLILFCLCATWLACSPFLHVCESLCQRHWVAGTQCCTVGVLSGLNRLNVVMDTALSTV